MKTHFHEAGSRGTLSAMICRKPAIHSLLPVLLPLAAGVPQQVNAAEKNSGERPNILLIIADDVSYYDLGCYGAKNVKTPNIDRLCSEGMQFTSAFNSSSMSTPTRHSVYTGMYPMKNGGYLNHSRVREDIISMPVYMRQLGYRVGLAGKWHIRPEYIFPFEKVPGFKVNCLNPDPSYTLEGVKEFIGRNDEQPFCLVLASINAHLPWTGGDPSVFDRAALELPPQMIDTPETRDIYARYLAEVALLDKEVGDMIDILEKKGIYDNTLIIFISEQGTEIAGAKWNNWQPGVKSGMIAKWGGHVAPGSKCDAIVQYEDILPTFIDVAGGKRPKDIDGRSIRKVLEGTAQTHRKYAFTQTCIVPEGDPYPIRSVTDGKYKLIWNMLHDDPYTLKHIENKDWFDSWRKKKDTDKTAYRLWTRYKTRPEFELYDISSDPFEMENLYGKEEYEKKAECLKKQLDKWMTEQNDLGIESDKLQ